MWNSILNNGSQVSSLSNSLSVVLVPHHKIVHLIESNYHTIFRYLVQVRCYFKVTHSFAFVQGFHQHLKTITNDVLQMSLLEITKLVKLMVCFTKLAKTLSNTIY